LQPLQTSFAVGRVFAGVLARLVAGAAGVLGVAIARKPARIVGAVVVALGAERAADAARGRRQSPRRVGRLVGRGGAQRGPRPCPVVAVLAGQRFARAARRRLRGERLLRGLEGLRQAGMSEE